MVVVRALDIPNRVLHKCPLKSEAGYLLGLKKGKSSQKRIRTFVDSNRLLT